MFAGSSSELYQIVNMMSALENKCLQEAVLTLCSGSLRCFALTYFSARCANADKSGYGAGVSEACNFNAVVDFLTISYSFVIVTDACETRQWILGDPADSFLGIILWDAVLGHAQACCTHICRRSGDLLDAPWLTSTVGVFQKKEKSRRGANLARARAVKAERAAARLANRLTSEATVAALSNEDMPMLLGDSFVDDSDGVVQQLESGLFFCVICLFLVGDVLYLVSLYCRACYLSFRTRHPTLAAWVINLRKN